MQTLEVEVPEKVHASRWNKFSVWIQDPRVQQTLCFCCGFWLLGMAVAAPGPAILALAKNTSSSVGSTGYVFVARSVGYLIGSGFVVHISHCLMISALGGPLFDKFNGNLLVSGALVLTTIGNFLIPLLSSLVLLAICNSFNGLAMGFLDTGGNVSIVWIWGSEVGPYMQSLHFSFGLGALISPLLIGASMENANGDPKYGFWIVSLAAIPISLWLLKFKRTRKPESSDSDKEVTHSAREMIVVGLAALYLLFDVGAEISSSGYLTAFSVEQHLTGETTGAFMTSLFWGIFTLGRLVAIPTSMYLSSATLLAISLTGCLITSIFWLLFIHSKVAIWIVVSMYGFFISVAFPTAITLTECYVSLTGKLTSIAVVGASFGEMIIPFGVAVLLDKAGPDYLVWMLLLCAIAGISCYLGILFVGKPLKALKSAVQYQPVEVESP